jgi:hypothetical protein
MNPFIEKLASVEKSFSAENGSFWLFALVERVESPEKWDLLVAAPWLQEESRRSLDDIIELVGNKLDETELLQLSRIIVLNPENPVVQHLTAAFGHEHTSNHVENTVINGMAVSRAVIITSNRPESSLAVT